MVFEVLTRLAAGALVLVGVPVKPGSSWQHRSSDPPVAAVPRRTADARDSIGSLGQEFAREPTRLASPC